MEFWGVEVKNGEKVSVDPGQDKYLHLSQASLGEVKKESENGLVHLYVESGDKKLVLGTLSSEKLPQTSFDLVFEKQFNLSHNWKNGSVYFCGYKAHKGEVDDASSDSDVGDDLLNAVGKPRTQENLAKPAAEAATASKREQKVKILDLKTDEDSSSDSDDESDETESSQDQDMGVDEDKSEEETESDESSDDDEETPAKAAPNNKRAPESNTKTPVPAKKSKVITPQKIDGKKGARTDTPHPAKRVAKTAATSSDQGKKLTQTSTGSFPCGSCNRSFKSEQALRSHSKDKHGASA